MAKLSIIAAQYTPELANPSKNGLFPHYTYLSFRKKIGWELVQLNCIQEFARKYFGCYSSTNLESLINGCHRTKLRGHVDDLQYLPALEQQLRDIWVAKKGAQTPYPTYSRAFSNASSLDQTAVMLFGERHTEKTYQIFIGRMLEKYYRSGDIILVEGEPAGEIVSKDDDNPLLGFLRYTNLQNPHIQGWEPPGAIECSQKLFKPAEELGNEVIDKIKNLCDQLPDRDHFIDNESEELQSEVKQLIQDTFSPLFSNRELRNKKIKYFNNITSIFFEGISKAQNPIKFAKALLFEIGIRILKVIEEQKYKIYSRSGWQDVKKMIDSRDDSLIQEINTAAWPGRRVFVIAGSDHVFTRKMATAIQHYAYAAFAARNSYQRSYSDADHSYQPFLSEEVL